MGTRYMTCLRPSPGASPRTVEGPGKGRANGFRCRRIPNAEDVRGNFAKYLAQVQLRNDPIRQVEQQCQAVPNSLSCPKVDCIVHRESDLVCDGAPNRISSGE